MGVPHGGHTASTWKQEIAWSGGFFCADGYITWLPGLGLTLLVARRGRRALELLDRLSRALAHGRIYRLRVRPSADLHVWLVSGADARKALDLLWPWLTEHRRDQALAAFERMLPASTEEPADSVSQQ